MRKTSLSLSHTSTSALRSRMIHPSTPELMYSSSFAATCNNLTIYQQTSVCNTKAEGVGEMGSGGGVTGRSWNNNGGWVPDKRRAATSSIIADLHYCFCSLTVLLFLVQFLIRTITRSTARKRSCEKVMFLVMSVRHSVRGGLPI